MPDGWAYSYKSWNTIAGPVRVAMTNSSPENNTDGQASSSVFNSTRSQSRVNSFKLARDLLVYPTITSQATRGFTLLLWVCCVFFVCFFFFKEEVELTQSEDWTGKTNVDTSSILSQGRSLLRCYNRQPSLKSVENWSPLFGLSFSLQLLHVVNMYSTVPGTLSKARELM